MSQMQLDLKEHQQPSSSSRSERNTRRSNI